MDLFAIVCPQCGSNNVSVSEKSNDAVCNSCGTKFLITDKHPNWYEENAVYEPAKRADRKLKFKPLYSTDVFLRNAIISILKKGASLELLGGTIAPVKTSWRRMLSERAIADVDYGGSVGYNRTETYVAIEEKYDKDLQKRVKVPVEKTRTVTDWRPISGQQRVTSVAGFVENEADGDVKHSDHFGAAFRSASKDLLEEDTDGNGSILPKIAEELHRGHENNYWNTIVKTVSADDVSRLKTHPKRETRIETVQWNTPMYETAFTAGGLVMDRYDYPIHEGGEVFTNDTKSDGKQVGKQLQEMEAMMKAGTGGLFWFSMIASVAAVIVMMVLNLFTPVSMNITAAISMAVAMFGFMFSRTILAKKLSSMTQLYEEKRIAAANAMLKKIGQKALTEQESGINETKAVFSENNKKRKRIFIWSVVTAIVSIVSFAVVKDISLVVFLAWAVCMFLLCQGGKNEHSDVSGHRGLQIASLVTFIVVCVVILAKLIELI